MNTLPISHITHKTKIPRQREVRGGQWTPPPVGTLLHHGATNDDAMADRILQAARKASQLVEATEGYLERSKLYKTILERVEMERPEDAAELQHAVHAFLRNKAEQHSIPYHPGQAEALRIEKRARIFKRLIDIQQEVRRLTVPTGCEQSIQLVLAACTGVLLAHATLH